MADREEIKNETVNSEIENNSEGLDGIQDIANEVTSEKKKFPVGTIIFIALAVLILAAFAGVVYYAKVILPEKNFNKELGYDVDEQVTLRKYTGFNYEITQDMWDDEINGYVQEFDDVDRAIKTGDQVDFNYTGYVNGKKDKNISDNQLQFIIGEDSQGVYKKVSDAIIGHKKKEIVKIDLTAQEANDLSKDGSQYNENQVQLQVKITGVAKEVIQTVTDEWVKENFQEEGLLTKEDFYEYCETELIEDTVKIDIWQMAVDAAKMKKYPQSVYDSVVEEFQADAGYNADFFGMSMEDYLYDFQQYTEESLEQEYLNGVKSELVKWAIAKEEGFKVTDGEINQWYEDNYEYVDCESVEEAKELYSKEEIKNAVMLEKVQQYVYDHSKIKKSYKIQ